VEQVLGDVPKGQRCACRETGRPAAAKKTATAVAAEPTTAVGRFTAWLRK
jgi:hypothetical protein